MVCKEEVFMWFKELTGSKRIGVMCGLLNMCYPLELRFFGTCLEDLGKKDFYCFQDAEQKANNANEVKKLTDLKDNVTRCKFIVSLALLHSSNHACSNVLYQTLTKHLEHFDLFSDDKTSNEMMLVLTMALNHPAFTFDQKTVLTQQLLAAEKMLGEANQTNHESHMWRRCASAVIADSIHQSTVSPCQNVSSASSSIVTSVSTASVAHTVTTTAVTASGTPCHHHHQVSYRPNDTGTQARISSLKYKGTHKRRSYRIRASWTNGKYTEVSKTCHELVVFHQKLLQMFPQDVFSVGKEKYIPPLPGIIASQCEEITEESISALNDFLRQLTLHLPVNILECDHVTNFFKSPLYGRSGIRGNKYFPNDSFAEDGVRVPSITIYNSHRVDGSSRSKSNMQHNTQNSHVSPSECSHAQQQVSTPPTRSPVSSPVSSPYISPPPSGTSSRSTSPWIQRPVSSVTEEKNTFGFEQLLRREHLMEYWEKLKPYKLEELQGMGLEKLEHIGISKAASVKLRKLLDNLRSCSGQNGIKNLLPVHSTSHHAPILSSHSPINQISSESSPSCSEYSSPPPSPPPSESPKQQNSRRTSSEESLHDKGGNSVKLEADLVQDGEDKHCCSNKQGDVKLDESHWNKDSWPVLAATPSPPLGYGPTVTHMHPQVQKVNHLPTHSKTSPPAPLGSSTVIFENGQYTTLPSALSFLPPSNNVQRSHSTTPERALPVSSVVTVPVTTVCPFPVVTSGCTTPTSCMTTYRNSGTATVTTAASLSNSRHCCPKNLSVGRENEGNHKLQQQSDVLSAHYTLTPAYLLPPSAVSVHPSQPSTCTGVCTVTSTVVASSVLSSPSSPGTPQQTHHTVSLPFHVSFLPHIFPQTFPFIQTHGNSPANGLISPAMTPQPSVHSFPFPIANSIPPELMYARQSFPIPPPSPNPNSVPNPAQSPVPAASSPGSAAYSNVNACYSKPTQSNGNSNSGKISCFSCGKFGHRGSDCKDASLSDGRNYTRPVCKNGNS